MSSPIKPSDVRALLVSGDESLCTAQIKAFIKLPILWYRYVKYRKGPGGEISDAMREEICAVARTCPRTPTNTP